MTSFLIYILKVTAGITVVTLPYFLFLRRDSNLRLKRYFLLAGLLVSFMVPLLKFNFGPPVITENPVFFLELNNPANTDPGVLTGTGKTTRDNLSLTLILTVIYLSGIAFLVLQNFISMLKWRSFRKANSGKNNHLLYSDNEEVFTFFRTIHLPRSAVGTEEYNSMLIHEQAHVHQLHFIDLLISETALFLTWFNPFTWLIRRMIKENHEHLADREVLSSGIDPVRYRAQLLNRTLGVPVFRLGMAFSYSLTKNRFDMMKNRSSNRKGLIKVLLLLPALLLTFGCLSNSKAQEGKIKGVVRFADTGKPATGASVIIAGTANGTVADQKGRFELVLPGKSDVFVSFVGYKTCTGTYKPGEQVTVELVPDVVNLELPPVATINDEITIKSKNGKTPLYIVDGEVVDDVSNITPDDIEKIDVIKDEKMLAAKFPGKNTEGGAMLITTKNKKPEGSSEETVFIVVEDMPLFPGGKEALSQYIYSHLKYPEKANGKTGSAVVQFTVDPEGKTKDIKVASSSNEVFNEPAMAVFNDMPAWKPGYQRGKAVAVQFAVRVDFKQPDN